MTKTAEQREKDLKAGPTWVVVTAWEKAISGFEKDLKAPIFLKGGNVAAFAAQYDTLQSAFNKHLDKKTAAADSFDSVQKQMDKIDAEILGLRKELVDIVVDENASRNTPELEYT